MPLNPLPKLLDVLKDKMPSAFNRAADGTAVKRKPIPSKLAPYILDAEILKAIEYVLNFSYEAIEKQRKQFNSLENDRGILEACLFGDTSGKSGDELNRHKKAVFADLKDATREDKEVFLRGVYNLFNGGKLDEKPAFVAWFLRGEADYDQLKAKVDKAAGLLRTKRVEILRVDRADEKDHERIRDQRMTIAEIGEVLDTSVAAVDKARGQMSFGNMTIFEIVSGAVTLLDAQHDYASFQKAFADYLDDVAEKFDKIDVSLANDEDLERWAIQKSNAMQTLAFLVENQATLLGFNPVAPEALEPTEREHRFV